MNEKNYNLNKDDYWSQPFFSLREIIMSDNLSLGICKLVTHNFSHFAYIAKNKNKKQVQSN